MYFKFFQADLTDWLLLAARDILGRLFSNWSQEIPYSWANKNFAFVDVISIQ